MPVIAHSKSVKTLMSGHNAVKATSRPSMNEMASGNSLCLGHLSLMPTTLSNSSSCKSLVNVVSQPHINEDHVSIF